MPTSIQTQLCIVLPCQPSHEEGTRNYLLLFSRTHRAQEIQYLLSNSQLYPVVKYSKRGNFIIDLVTKSNKITDQTIVMFMSITVYYSDSEVS